VIGPAPVSTDIELRPALDGDRSFLLSVYVSCRRAELDPLGWDEEATLSFLRTQYEHEERDWRLHQPGAEQLVVVRGGVAVGRLSVARSAHEIRVMDLTLLPQHRGQGIATALVTALVDEAEATRRTVRMHVDRGSPLEGLCRRLGFLPAATRAGSWLMEWTAEVPLA